MLSEIDVGLGDLAVRLVLGEGLAVGGEPFLSGDEALGLGVVDVASSQLRLGALSRGSGARGVDEPM